MNFDRGEGESHKREVCAEILSRFRLYASNDPITRLYLYVRLLRVFLHLAVSLETEMSISTSGLPSRRTLMLLREAIKIYREAEKELFRD